MMNIRRPKITRSDQDRMSWQYKQNLQTPVKSLNKDDKYFSLAVAIAVALTGIYRSCNKENVEISAVITNTIDDLCDVPIEPKLETYESYTDYLSDLSRYYLCR